MQRKSSTETNSNLFNPNSPLKPEKKTQQSMEDAHMNGVALFLCILAILAGVGLAIYMDENGVATGWTLVVSIGLMLVGMITGVPSSL